MSCAGTGNGVHVNRAAPNKQEWSFTPFTSFCVRKAASTSKSSTLPGPSFRVLFFCSLLHRGLRFGARIEKLKHLRDFLLVRRHWRIHHLLLPSCLDMLLRRGLKHFHDFLSASRFGSVLHGDYAPTFVVAVCLSTLRTSHACHYVPAFLLAAPVFDVEPCGVILREVLATSAALRYRKRTHFASLAC